MNGLLVINKEPGYTSRDVVNLISKKFNTDKVGHTGTLDPLATGVLVLALGTGLKLVEQLTSDTKEYIATVKFGILTDTLDVTGNILDEQKNYKVDKKQIINVLNCFLGKNIQEVPLYSAIKVNGKRLYEYAREGTKVELPKREVEIFSIELIELKDDEFSFRVKVSKGTYIRSLIRDIGKQLGIYCCMKNLNRIKQGNFSIKDSYTLEDILNNKYKLIPLVDCLDNFEIVEVDDFIKNKVLNGRILENRYNSEKIAFIDKDKNLLALYKPYEKDKTKIKPIKVIKNEN